MGGGLGESGTTAAPGATYCPGGAGGLSSFSTFVSGAGAGGKGGEANGVGDDG